MNKPCVYLIRCPFTKNVVYVGQTLNPKIRFKSHLICCKTAIGLWIQELKSNGNTPLFEILKSFDRCRYKTQPDLKSAMIVQENEYICLYIKQGEKLLNKNNIHTWTSKKFINPKTT